MLDSNIAPIRKNEVNDRGRKTNRRMENLNVLSCRGEKVEI